MIEIIKNIVDRFSDFMLGIDRAEDEEKENKKVTYNITSIFPSEKIMHEAEKYL